MNHISSTERERLKALERENRELKQANEILRKTAAFFAQAEHVAIGGIPPKKLLKAA